jgi:hypothetical protein
MKSRIQRLPTTLRAAFFIGSIAAGLITFQVHAQTAAPSAITTSGVKKATLTSQSTSPDWSTLTRAQQQALQPLASIWPKLSEAQKKKWIALSANYPSLSDSAKERLHERMVQWAALTPRQRTQARLNFAKTQQVPAEDKTERWEVYQALTAEQKKTLAASAPKLPLAPQVSKPIKPVMPKTPASAASQP